MKSSFPRSAWGTAVGCSAASSQHEPGRGAARTLLPQSVGTSGFMKPIELSFWQLAVAVSLILISAAISAALQPGAWKAVAAGGRPHHGPTALNRPRARVALRVGQSLVFRARHDVGHDLHRGHLGRAAKRIPLHRHLDRQRHRHVGDELADDGHRPVRRRANPRGQGARLVVHAAVCDSASGHDPRQARSAARWL